MVLIASPNARILSRWKRPLEGIHAVQGVAQRAALEESIANHKPALLLLDAALLKLNGMGELSALHQHSPKTKIILLTARPNETEGISALKAGARGYCNKNIEPTLLKKAIQRVQKGEIWVGRNVIPHLLDEIISLTARRQKDSSANLESRLDRLTPRERKIAQLIGNSANNRDIAHQLDISERTVKVHLTNIFRKLGLSDRLRLALLVTKHIGASH